MDIFVPSEIKLCDNASYSNGPFHNDFLCVVKAVDGGCCEKRLELFGYIDDLHTIHKA